MKIRMFKAKKQTHRFRKNQKVWITDDFGNHMFIRFKWRGSGRYVSGVIGKWDSQYNGWNKAIGQDGLKEIEVSEGFGKRIRRNNSYYVNPPNY